MKKRKIVIGSIIGFAVIFVGLIIFAISYYYYTTYHENRATTYHENRAPLEIKTIPQKNPTSYIFEGDIAEVRARILKATSSKRSEEEDKAFPFKSPDNQSRKADYFVTTKDEAFSPDLEKLFEKPENLQDIYLENDGLGIISPTYYALGKPLRYLIDFHIHLESVQDNKTKVSIIPVKPRVYKGYKGRGMHGALLPKQVPVEPTTIEEYQLLRYIGFVLGEEDMPEVLLPE